MTLLGLIQKTTLAQATTNSVIQFTRIVLKILALYLQNQVLPFLDNVRIKGLKSIYNYKKLVLGIKQYIIEHIQNLDKILADLEEADVIISEVKFQLASRLWGLYMMLIIAIPIFLRY